ncbi:hypothetical protein [uncultured Draconibacterium sp.]|uniref:hypothetical protein n=1 Tax=uncultured Draconibacterium sp. TaxID=1573823 RepID=UPI003217AC06
MERPQVLPEQTFMPWRITKACRNKLSGRGEPPKLIGANFHAVENHQRLSEQTFMPWWITKACRNKLLCRGGSPKLVGAFFQSVGVYQC